MFFALYGLDPGLSISAAYPATEADSASPCGTGEGGECQSSWCYVDMDACLQNETACVAAGGVLGSYDSEHCRTRLTMASTLNL